MSVLTFFKREPTLITSFAIWREMAQAKGLEIDYNMEGDTKVFYAFKGANCIEGYFREGEGGQV